MSTSALLRPSPDRERSQRQARRNWPDRRVGYGLSAVLVIVAALVSAWWTPRGPLTTGEALVSLIAALAVGALVGTAVARRWVVLATPAVYVAVFELARLDAEGPTVDAIDLTSVIGVAAFVVGRGIHGVLVLAPLVLGTGYGLWLARRLGRRSVRAPGVAARATLVVLTLALALLVAVVARPAMTAPIVGSDGRPLPGSIAEFETVEIGGVDQVLLIRGRDATAPILLHLAGGPGGTDIGAMRQDAALEQRMVVVTWEQRGTGKSYATSIDPVEDLTLEQAVADTLAVADHLRERFGKERIYLTGNSWGTIPSALAVRRAPEKFHAYIGTGQMVDVRLTDQMFHEDALAWAESTGRDELARRIRAAGPPPYGVLTDYQFTVGYEHQWNHYPGVADLYEMPVNTFVPENSFMDRANAMRAMFDVNWFVYPQLQDDDLREHVPRLEVPVYIVLGEHEARGRDVLARDWFARLDAPSKELVVFQGAGHRPSFERPEEFARLLQRVVAATAGAS